MLRMLSIGGACLALAFAAGCGDDDEPASAGGGSGDTGTESAAAPTTTPAETAAESSSGDVIVVRMKGFQFSPATVQAKVGQTIEWVNDDAAPHNAVDDSGASSLKTDTVDKGGKVTYEVDEAGTIKYICTVHPQMKGTIEATE